MEYADKSIIRAKYKTNNSFLVHDDKEYLQCSAILEMNMQFGLCVQIKLSLVIQTQYQYLIKEPLYYSE